MTGIPDRSVLEQIDFRPHNLIHLGPHLPPYAVHAPRPPVPRPRFVTQEEVRGHILQTGGHNVRHDILSAVTPLRRHDFRVEVPFHQHFIPAGALVDGIDDALDDSRIIGVNVASNNKPPLSRLTFSPSIHKYPHHNF